MIQLWCTRVLGDGARERLHQPFRAQRHLVGLRQAALVFAPDGPALLQPRNPGRDGAPRVQPRTRGLGQEFQARLRVAQDAVFGRVVAADLARVDVDLDQARWRDGQRVAIEPGAGRAVIEGKADGEDDIGVARRVVRRIGAVAPRRAEGQRVAIRDRALAVRAGDDRDAGAFREGQQGIAGVPDDDPLPGDDDGLLRAQQQVERGREFRRIARRAVDHAAWRVTRRVGCLLHEHVQRHIEVHRPRPPGRQLVPGLRDRQRHHVGACRLEGPLHIGAHHRGEIALEMPPRLLERPAVELPRRHIAGDGKEGAAVHHRRSQRHHQVRRPRPARRERRHRLPAHLVVGVGHVACGLLVMRGHRADAVLRLEGRIHEAGDAVPAQAKQVRHLPAHQVVHDDVGAVHQRCLAAAVHGLRFLGVRGIRRPPSRGCRACGRCARHWPSRAGSAQRCGRRPCATPGRRSPAPRWAGRHGR